MTLEVGLDQLSRGGAPLTRLRGSRVGLLAHPASVDREFRHASEVLASLGVQPRVFFGPEHGYGGEAQYMESVADGQHPLTGAPVISLYGDTFASLSPREEHLALMDVLVIDLADVGARYYTFVWTALLAARAAARKGVHVLLLDRPNPLGRAVEGKENQLRSFVGLEPLPVRHGLTVGEIVATFLARDGLPLGPGGALSLVAPRWAGEEGWHWDRPFIPTSPNMPTLDTALVYPGGCLLEGTNLSEGRGTTRPFELVGAPWLDGKRLAERLNRSGLPGFVARAVTFCPTFHKFAGQICRGIQIHPTDRSRFLPYATYLALIGFVREMHLESFAFQEGPYEFVNDIPAFDLLTGSREAREALTSGEPPVEVAHWMSHTEPGSLLEEARSAVNKARYTNDAD
ncbi:MAG: DUF1343 domain-containing protein [Myxococcales bacterium]|nr:DUF1343 domain-containing protein [Polyangiaceae bacterium]MDW8248097.1 DUF1343 domain-containing protein [Myxococcales bacterium]